MTQEVADTRCFANCHGSHLPLVAKASASKTGENTQLPHLSSFEIVAL